MGLFDDLLKKPSDTSTSIGDADQSSTGQGLSGGTQDPLTQTATPIIKIEKTEEVSIITESPKDSAPSAPAPVTVMAMDDSSSIIIHNDPIISDPIIMPTPTVSTPTEMISHMEIINNTPTTDVSTEKEESATITDLGNLFSDTRNTSSITTTIFENNAPSSNGVPVIETTPLDMDVSPIVEISTLTDSMDNASSFIPETIENTGTQNTSVENTQTIQKQEEHSSKTIYEHPQEFITDSIARIDAMISCIDGAQSIELEKAQGYREEKEKYATLEKQAYADAEKYIKEKEHALTMREYLIEQKNTNNSSKKLNSVETTLTELAVQNAVTDTVTPNKKTNKKTTTSINPVQELSE